MRGASVKGSETCPALLMIQVMSMLLVGMVALMALYPSIAFSVEYNYVAHQGKVNAKYKGNTIQAFEQAASTEGIYGIETDIWRTRDGQYVCMHGKDTGEASDGKNGATWAGMNVWNTDLEELCSVEVKGYALPTLQEYLAICKEGGKKAFIEIKNPELADDASYADGLVSIIHESGMLNQCVFTSWIGRAKSVYYLKQAALKLYGVNVPAHIGSGRTNEKVDEAIQLAKEYGLDGIGTYPGIPQQEYAYEKLQGTGLQLRSTGALKNERYARELIERYGIWALYCEFAPTLIVDDDQAVAKNASKPAFDVSATTSDAYGCVTDIVSVVVRRLVSHQT